VTQLNVQILQSVERYGNQPHKAERICYICTTRSDRIGRGMLHTSSIQTDLTGLLSH